MTPPRRSDPTLPIAFACIAAFLVAALYPVVFQANHPSKPVFLSHLRYVACGLALYAADADDRMPLARLEGRPTALGWAGRIFPYVKDNAAFHDPLAEEDILSDGLNANVAELPATAAWTAPSRTVLLFPVAGLRLLPSQEAKRARSLRLSPVGDGAKNGLRDAPDPKLPPEARYATGALANSGLGADEARPFRSAPYFAFADTHVKPLSPREVSAGANAAPDGHESPAGCRRPDLPTADLPPADRPCAEAARAAGRRATFSLR